MKKIYINVEDFDTSVAIVEDEKLINFFIEKNTFAKTGNIYKGKISKVVSNMNFVFVNIGDKKPAFLSEKEYFDSEGDEFREIFGDEDDGVDIKPQASIIGIFEKGQELIVQAIKESYHTKGVRLTTNITFPGHYVVYGPFLKHIGISKRILNDAERKRLRGIVEQLRDEMKEDFGVIIRTQAQGVSKDELEREIKYYIELWKQIKEDFKKNKAPLLLYKEHGLAVRVLREYMDDSVEEIVVDSVEVCNEMESYAHSIYKKNINIKSYAGASSIFEYYNIKNQVDNLHKNIVSFKKGGYIKIDVTEALTVFDVNSGKFKGMDDMEDGLLLMNENAAKEVARQIVLRNIGGIIVVDFIDMLKDENKVKIKKIVETELGKSKSTFLVSEISQFGLMEITRKRAVNRIEDMFFEECPCCKGRGRVLNKEGMVIDALKKIKYTCKKEPGRNIVVQLSPDIKRELEKEYKDKIKEYERKYLKKITIKEEKVKS